MSQWNRYPRAQIEFEKLFQTHFWDIVEKSEGVRMEQKPSVGRIVHFLPSSGYTETIAGIIIFVEDQEQFPGKVWLQLFNPPGWHKDVMREQADYSQEPKPGYWSWPPRV